MAIDEAVWLGRRAGASSPTIRFFAWAPPTVSLGYGQPLDRHVDVAACRRLGLGLVRRPTGGSAIYHDGPERELTYSVVAAADDIGGGARDLLHSAQRRYGRTFLQHGSVLLGVDAPRLGAIFPTTPDPLATLTTLEAALGHRPKFDDVAAALASAFESEHGLDLRPEGLTAGETAAVERLVRE